MELFELYSLIVVLCHLPLILGHSSRSLVFNFVQTVQVQLQLVVVAVFIKEFHLGASKSYFNRDHCFCAICQVERCFLL